MNFKAEMNERVEQIEQILDQYLPPKEGLQKTVLTAMNTTVKAGGKRLRPMLINETYKMFGGEGDIVKPFMAAIEMIHTYSLIHDDLPALDNDDYRRGQKTCHIVYGEDMAILAGDALLNYAYEVATKAFDLADQDEMMNVVEAVKILARKPGIYGMIGGQVADVELEGTPLSMEQILFIHKNKTSVLIEACMMIGAVLAGASKEDVMAMEECGEYIGLAFQIQDDILDLTGDEEEIGKPVGSDEKNHKTTYVTLKGLKQSAKDVEEISKKAIEILARYDVGDRYLTNLTRFLIHRTH
ncbi:MAG: polyprenyl synthetase family protein [Firmicutes bacterium]|nr:polyprenyl synthetase family protein [Bacillota bacterium]